MSTLKEFAAFFIENQCLFGAYPTQERIVELEKWGVRLIVDLTTPNEKKCIPYVTEIDVIKFPIDDRKGPSDKIRFCKLIIDVADRISTGDKIYVHCKGGHGRSGMVVAALLCFKYKIDPPTSFAITSAYHSTRTNIKPYWLKVGSPQTWLQKLAVYTIFNPHYITPISPFSGDASDAYVDAFLCQTYLGEIIGENGKNLEERRKRLLIQYEY